MSKVKVSFSMGGQFRLVRHRPPFPGAQFEDLWDRLPDGTLVPKDRKGIAQEHICNNKYTKRGLSYMLYALQAGHGLGTALIDTSITGATTSNPFEALFLMTDVPSPPRPTPYDGDARPLWTESDTSNDPYIPPAPTPDSAVSHYMYEGRRGCKYHGSSPNTSGPGLKYVSSSWVGEPPYGEGELIFYAQAQIEGETLATGFVEVTGVAGWVDGTDTFTISDGLNPPVIFEFDTDGVITEGVPGTNYRTRVYVGDTPTLQVVAQRIRDAINALDDRLYITAELDDVVNTRVNLTNYAGGTIGNVAITETVADASFAKSGMAGATDPVTTGVDMDDTQICNFPIQSIGMAMNRNCGNGETNSKIGLRAILGLAGTVQGVCDRRWVHEHFNYATSGAEDLHKYVPAEQFGTIRGSLGTAAGYVTSGETADTVLATFDNGIAITAATKEFEFDEAQWLLTATLGFDVEHRRLTLRVTNSGVGGNNRDFHIRKIVSPNKVRVFETVAGDDDDTTTPALQVQLVMTYAGDNCFDGNVENEGLTYDPTPPYQDTSDPWAEVVVGQKWSSAAGAGPHLIGRVFDSPLSPSGTPKTLTSFWLVAPPGVSREYLPDEFLVDILDGGGSPPTTVPDQLEPANNNHWTQVAAYAGGESDDIYLAGRYGREYTITTPAPGYGFRLSAVRSLDDAQHVELAQIMLAEDVGAPDGFPITLSSARLKTSIDAGSNDVYVDIPDVPATSDVDDIVNALNRVLVGHQVEAVRSTHGYLWTRCTVQGNNAPFRVYNYGASATLGLTGGSDEDRVGVTQPLRKLVMEALTIIYRFSIWGNKLKAL